MKGFDCLVVGAGFAGSVLAERMASELDKKVLLVERRKHIGGNCFDYKNSDQILLHRYGPHLFHTDRKEVVEYLSRFCEWEPYEHRVLASIDGMKVPIPFNFNTLERLFPKTLAQRYEKSLLEAYTYGTKVPILELKRSDDPILQQLADFVYEKVFVHYSAKQWGMKPEEMDSAVTARVPVFVGRDDRYFNDSYQMLPKEGYTALFEKMLEHPNIKLMLNTDFSEIGSVKEGGFTLFGSPFEGDVIYTGEIDALFDYCYGALAYRSVEMRFETLDQEWYQEAATVNYPNDYDFTRITEFKRIHPVNSERTTILKEYPQPHIPGKNTPYYPIFTDENRVKYEQYAKRAQKFERLTLVGRLAEYRYYDMDDVVARALDVFQQIRDQRS